MRKVFAWVFLFIWLINFAGGSLYFLAQLHRQKQYMRCHLASLPREQLHVIEFSHEEFVEARVEDNELLINGSMFDIAFTEINNNTILVFGLYDNNEDLILAALKKEAKKETNDPKTNHVLKQLCTMQFVLHQSLALAHLPYKNIVHNSYNCIRYEYNLPSVDGPPPEHKT
jgi:hypothetical protein